jgi:nitroreductase
VDTRLAITSKRDWRRYADRRIPDDVAARILDAGRVTGSAQNRQPWTFVVVESDDRRRRLAELVYVADNVLAAGLVVVIATRGTATFDAGRAAQDMMLAAWNEGVVSCPNGFTDRDGAKALLGLRDEENVVNAISFGYPTRPRSPEERSADEWSSQANRKPLEDVVRRI